MRSTQPALWSTAAPLVCAVHCVAAPVTVLLVPALIAPVWMEPGLMFLSIVLAIGFGASGFRVHRRTIIGLPLAAGTLVWIASLAGWLEPLPETVTTVAGSLLLAAGMVWNARFRHQTVCGSCRCPAHTAGSVHQRP